jgi:UTP-glucose-1-phosphate uridylyltransferase
MISANRREHGEFQFTPCLEELRRREGVVGLVVEGERFDIGAPDSFRTAVEELARAMPAPETEPSDPSDSAAGASP